jgi:hypothetical protein
MSKKTRHQTFAQPADIPRISTLAQKSLQAAQCLSLGHEWELDWITYGAMVADAIRKVVESFAG